MKNITPYSWRLNDYTNKQKHTAYILYIMPWRGSRIPILAIVKWVLNSAGKTRLVEELVNIS